MKSTLPAGHLLRQYLLFVLTALFLLTMVRAGYALWQFPHLEETEAFVPLFVQGLRFDLALIGMICLVPVVIGSLLSMMTFTRWLAKFVITLFLFGGLFVILLLEMITPWFIHTQGVRPDMNLVGAIEAPLEIIRTIFTQNTLPAVIGVVFCLLVLIAYIARMELARFLRYRTAVPASLLMSLIAGVLCVVAIWSTPDVRKAPLGPGDALISANTTVNDLAMNSAYKTFHSIALPLLNQ